MKTPQLVTIELVFLNGRCEPVEVDWNNQFQPIIIGTWNDEPSQAFILTGVKDDGMRAVYKECDVLRIGN